MATPDPRLINTTDFFIDPNTVTIDLSDSRKYSFVQRLGRQVQFGYAGGRYLNLEDISGGFVGAEGGRKPVANPVTTKGEILVREWAVVVPVPKRLFNANPQAAIQLIRNKLPEAFARDFDTLALTGAGVGGQSNLSTVSKTVTLGTTLQPQGGLWTDFNNGLALLVNDSKRMTGSVLDERLEPVINSEVDTNGRPIWTDIPVGPDTAAAVQRGRLINRPSELVHELATGTGVTETVGYLGDFNRLVWGTVGGVDYFVSQEGTYVDEDNTTHSAVQENLILFRAEALIGVQVTDADAFVRVLAGETLGAS